jgi:hypothetical protein
MAETLDPNAEFADKEPDEKPEVKEVPESLAVKPEEVEHLKSELAKSLKSIEALSSKTAIVDRLQELFTGRPEDPKDAYVKKEIQRLVPELDDVKKIKEVLPYILQALNLDAETKVEERTENAQEIMKGLMEDVGLDPKDDDAVGYVEEALAREIKTNPELLKLWNRGNLKSAVGKAFDKVSTKLFAPVRLKTKRSAVNTITESPRPSPKGGPGAPSGKSTKLDFADTSRDNVKKIHDAAWERLQELTQE